MDKDALQRKKTMNQKARQRTLVWLWRVSGKEKRNVFFLILLQGFLGISTVLFAWLLRGCIDSAVSKNADSFIFYAVAMVVVVALQISCRALNRFLDEYTRSGMENCFKARMFHQLLTREYTQIESVHSGEWMNRLTSDVVVVAEGMTAILPEVVGMSVKLTGAVTALLILIPQMGYFIVFGGILLACVSTVFRRVLKKMHTEVQEADGELRVLLSERLSGMLIVRTFARVQETQEEACQQMQKHRRTRMRRSNFRNFCNVGMAVIMNGVYMLGVLYCGYGILVGQISYGSFTAVLQLISQIQSPFASLTGFLPKYYAMLASAERLMEAENYEPVAWETMLDIDQIKEFYEKRFRTIYLKDVRFAYKKPVFGKSCEDATMPMVFENICLEIYKGDCVAVTGPSGSGKSTVLKLLMNLYAPDSGSRYIETVDGDKEILDIRYNRLFAYVPQGNYLMSGSIREIVAFSDKNKMKDDACIWQALSIACASEFVEELPEKLDSRLGERGAGLSEGQMQRIAIARAVCSGNPILILDEVTSALDEETEQQIISNLHQMTDRTVILVTHRPAMLKLCNRQVVLENNHIEVMEYGE